MKETEREAAKWWFTEIKCLPAMQITSLSELLK